MNSNEWPLVFFTLLSQMTAGIIIISFIVGLFVRNSELLSDFELKRNYFFVSLVLMVIALAISFFHLSAPLQSVFALANLQTSWLSREIFCMSMFTFLIAVCCAAVKFGIPGISGLPYWHIAAAFTGLLLVWIMARLYMIPIVPAWNNYATMIGFFTSIFLLGGVALLVILVVTGGKSFPFDQLKPVMWALIVVVSLAVVAKLLNVFLFQSGISFTGGSLPPPEAPFSWHVIHVIFFVAGFFLLAYWAYSQMQHTELYRPQMVYLSFALLFVSEIFGRAIFYALYYRLGM